MVGTLHAVCRKDLIELLDSHELISISLELPGLHYTPIDQPSAQSAFDKRCRVMEQFLDNEKLKESVQIHGNLGHLVSETAQQHKVSKSYVYKLWLNNTKSASRTSTNSGPFCARLVSPKQVSAPAGTSAAPPGNDAICQQAAPERRLGERHFLSDSRNCSTDAGVNLFSQG